MNLRELTFPIRIYWDLNPSAQVSSKDNLRICDEIVNLKILSLNLSFTDDGLGTSCIEILERLKTENIAISLTVTSSALDAKTISMLGGLKVRAVFADVSSLNDLRDFLKGKEQIKDLAVPVGISFNLDRNNYKDIPDILFLCSENKIDHLVFPMQRLIDDKDCFYMAENEREGLASRLKTIDLRNIKLIIHDPFLWKVFNPEERYPEGGCQGANSMLYISADNNVYPCPSMPVNLGTLLETSLREIILSAKKKELRVALNAVPEECLDCEEKEHCVGGCRGRAYVLKKSLKKADPACK
jgi:GeoRSP system SPASM domain protein